MPEPVRMVQRSLQMKNPNPEYSRYLEEINLSLLYHVEREGEREPSSVENALIRKVKVEGNRNG